MLGSIHSLARRARRQARRRRAARLPLRGWDEGRVSTPLLEQLGDTDLARLNELLPWQCFTVDSNGRRFGSEAWSGKRSTPQEVPDRRIVAMNDRFGLRDRTVLEVGCFEGVHTVGLAQFGSQVHATDSRVENVVKTAVRCAFFGLGAAYSVWDVEAERRGRESSFDLIHHVGVLYHLADPVSHLLDIGLLTTAGLMLDTHVATDESAVDTYEVEGRRQRYMRYREYGREDPFSGMRDHAKWLPLDDLVDVVGMAGFDRVDVVERREERNGLRVLLFAEKIGHR